MLIYRSCSAKLHEQINWPTHLAVTGTKRYTDLNDTRVSHQPTDATQLPKSPLASHRQYPTSLSSVLDQHAVFPLTLGSFVVFPAKPKLPTLGNPAMAILLHATPGSGGCRQFAPAVTVRNWQDRGPTQLEKVLLTLPICKRYVQTVGQWIERANASMPGG